MTNELPQFKLETNYSLFIIPSWGALLGYPTLGKYINQDVSKIHSDPVFFFSGLDTSIRSDLGLCYYLFGLGYYYCKFELQDGKYIVDKRELSGLILPDFVYDYMANAKKVSLHDNYEVIINEAIINVPLRLGRDESQKSFINGILMRNVFIPYKDFIIEIMDLINTQSSYLTKKRGHLLLSAHWSDYNKILISNDFEKASIPDYINSTAGLHEIVPRADEYLSKFPSDKVNLIDLSINNLKSAYSYIDFDPMSLTSILENASKFLGLDYKSPPLTGNESILGITKQHIFKSGKSQLSSFKPWPDIFPRKVREEIAKEPYKDSRITPGMQNLVKLSNIREQDALNEEESGIPQDSNKFELRILEHKTVESRNLPEPPEDTMINILTYVKSIIEQDYDMISIGKAFEMARDNMRKIVLHSDYMWDMSKYANFYQRKKSNLSLNLRDKTDLLEKIEEWIFEIKEQERLEIERLEREKIDKIRKEKEIERLHEIKDLELKHKKFDFEKRIKSRKDKFIVIGNEDESPQADHIIDQKIQKMKEKQRIKLEKKRLKLEKQLEKKRIKEAKKREKSKKK